MSLHSVLLNAHAELIEATEYLAELDALVVVNESRLSRARHAFDGAKRAFRTDILDLYDPEDEGGHS